jgi:hypothetical protein
MIRPFPARRRSRAGLLARCHGAGRPPGAQPGRHLRQLPRHQRRNARGDMKPLAGVAGRQDHRHVADYKSGNQPATIMHQIAKGYTDEQIKLIAAYFRGPAARK